MAPQEMVGTQGGKAGRIRAAQGVGPRAATEERAAAGRRATRLARHLDEYGIARGERADRGDQTARVGVAGGVEDGVGRTDLDDRAGDHDGDAVAQAARRGKIVGDEQNRAAGAPLPLADEVENLLGHHGVEVRGRLVGHDEVGLEGPNPSR